MRQSTRTILAAIVAAGLVAAVLPSPASAAFDTTQLKCRSTIAKGAAKLTKTYMKAMTGCHKLRDADGSMSGTDCNDIATADVALKVPTAETKFGEQVLKVCTGTPSTLLYESCPVPCEATLSSYADVSACLTCLGRDSAEDLAGEALRTPVPPLSDKDDAACHKAVYTNTAKFYNGVLKTIIKCQGLAEKSGTVTTENCTETTFATQMWTSYVKARDAVAKACLNATLPSATLDPCNNASSADALAACVVEAAWDEGQALVSDYLSLPTPDPVPPTTTTTTLPSAAGCPDVGELTLFSKLSNIACVDNTDCTLPRTCDPVLLRCTTRTDLDSGWKGSGHNADIDDQVRTRAHLYCANPGPSCGQCDVTGIDSELGNCRCVNNPRQLCNEPFASGSDSCPACSGGPLDGRACSEDSDCNVAGTCGRRCENNVGKLCTTNADCPGSNCPELTKCADGVDWLTSTTCSGTCDGTCTTTSGCECYLGTPFPLNSGGTPLCIVNRFAQDVTGTANVDLGAGAISASLRAWVYFGGGASNAAPCPTCGGKCSDDQSACNSDVDCGIGPTCELDSVAGDGNREGFCIGGASDGLSCDAMASNASSPAAFGYSSGGNGGGLYSIDCLPTGGSTISPGGLSIALNQTTGTSTLNSGIDCNGPEAGTTLCPCLVCSADETVPCNTNAECASGPGGTCTAKGAGIYAAPNNCTGGLCSNLGGGEGECTTGPNDRFCDQLVKADGGGILSCSSNAACLPAAVGTYAGTCTLLERRKCFLNPITATGSPDVDFPVAVSTFCVPPTANGGINSVVGLPGPGRVINQAAAATFCASDHNVEYEPGAGNCP